MLTKVRTYTAFMLSASAALGGFTTFVATIWQCSHEEQQMQEELYQLQDNVKTMQEAIQALAELAYTEN